MGMFDDVIVNDPIPVPEGFERVQGENFQTKSLECGLSTYKIEDGRLWVQEYGGEFTFVESEYHGDVVFYDFYTVPGESGSKLVDFVARFSYGKCDYINYVGYH